MKKKLLALILACLMVLPMVVSCKKDKDEDETTKAPSKNPTESDSEYAHIDEYIDELAAEYNYDGITFNMLDNGSSYPEFYEETGDLEDDALYYRYRDLEENFGIEIERLIRTEEGTDFEYSGQAIADDVKRDQFAGGSSYDLVCGGVISCGQNLVSSSVIRSAAELPGIDLSQTWWVQDIEDKFSIAGDLYYLTGKIVDSHYSTPSMMVYSKKVAKDYNITENLYEVVEAGDWTIDKMFEVASAIPTNTSGNGAYRYIWSGDSAGYAFYEAGGFYLTDRDDSGNPTVATALTSEQQDYISKLADVFGDHTQNFDVDTYAEENGYNEEGSEYVIYAEQRFLFSCESLGGIKTLRDENVEIGILPMPKRNAEQKDYRSFSSGWAMFAVYFPKNLKDEEMSGVITEAMAALSEKYMEPAYYEKALQGRSTYDLESRDMLDIIYNNVTVDLTECYESAWGSLYRVVGDAVMGVSSDITSSYNSSARIINKKIEQTIKRIEKANAEK